MRKSKNILGAESVAVAEQQAEGAALRKTSWAMIWNTIWSHKEQKGQWYRVAGTETWDEKKIYRAQIALERRRYRNGCAAGELLLVQTRLDGLCFRWKEAIEGTQI